MNGVCRYVDMQDSQGIVEKCLDFSLKYLLNSNFIPILRAFN